MEIFAEIDLTTEEEAFLDMHSVLNVLNVVMFELLTISDVLDDPESVEKGMEEIRILTDCLREKDQALRQMDKVEEFTEKILSVIDEAMVLHGSDHPEKRKKLNQSRDNLLTIFDVLKVRSREIVSRAKDSDGWVEHDIGELRSSFRQVFQAIEQNSKGRYRILRNIALHEEGDYFLTFDIDSENGKTVIMPAVFQDVMRDLIANARKYTPPGGEIIAGLFQGRKTMIFVVEDTGFGIPEAEIGEAVRFGFRGSNVRQIPTKGGGFGLTKACHTVSRHGGRMWIDRREKGGTRIKIVFPLPVGAGV